MLNLPTLHTYLTQLLSPTDTIHTALLLTPEGAVVSFALGLLRTQSLQRSKDEIWILAGLSAEVWAETRCEEGDGKGMGMVESELGRIVVVPVDDASPEVQDEREPLLLLAVNGGAEADWKTMCAKRTSLLTLLGSSHPSLNAIAQYYFLHPSKQLRPLLVLLFARATNGLGAEFPQVQWAADHSRAHQQELDAPLTRKDVLCDWNPSMPDHTASFESAFEMPLTHSLLPTQLRLAQIVEMIHVASLLHDDVLDKSPLRRGAASAPAAFGNKLAVLGGDFLLGRASAALSRLGSHEVVELIASVLANLVEGEILQMKGNGGEAATSPSSSSSVGSDIDLKDLHSSPAPPSSDKWSIYLKKTYLKTASLMAKGARAAVVLGGCREGEVWKEVAYAYGRNLGIAFQLIDDTLDFSSSTAQLGKPGFADLRLGLATGPALYAAEEFPELEGMIGRRFGGDGDVERALTLISSSRGVERTRELARIHAEKAREVLALLPRSEARDALEGLTEGVVRRQW
ncbi:isoprenoid synthase domain-containing protein [Suillus paluster]|uniref:isoprenoid synthase domain-containing protein n=1 Tax=Suillus paluster TaxID=48578 RepID=UPI001B87DDEE|nr:isoprenoid synthase domain-containing protein [Suillus paluster]KAG1738681.1 isoprenoid synthase domain-containing protein [Suillus paluster]